MQAINNTILTEYVKKNISSFHARRLQSLTTIKLRKILLRKNPYLFKAKNILTAQEIVKTLLDAHLSSQEETIFGEFLEGLAIAICSSVYGGRKSSAEGIDLEFSKDAVHYIVTIKSGPNWGNSGQIANMKSNFTKAKKILRTSQSLLTVTAVNGCCYGKCNSSDKGEYVKLCGQDFWKFISGNDDLYLSIIKPLEYKAKEKNEEFYAAYAQIINAFTMEFGKEFCSKDGKILWEKIVQYNSSSGKV
ncbi:MAG: PmeII family type II restriction endonuclease [bacterium]